ncbi:cisplatin damage response ATP-dependent DNA ligase [Legionella erythra]|uniref:DNA ligase (ATP) n=1 Tax=Legionella erythra TaxID=448 RepID=A0A0W0TKG8_LEGER|nr:cisplatin damage response ATP-dependent DNA ligase [Legionella erythra]KTC96108.1 ATP dependent DNA ligase [Legionella erythra]
MKKFAALLNTLYFTYSHLDKMALLHHYFTTTPDPERGYALAIMADTLDFPTFGRTLIKELIQEKIDPVLFAYSYDYVGDLSDTIALLWPAHDPATPLPLLSDLINSFNQLPRQAIREHLANLLNQANTIERWAILKLGTGSLRIGISARFLKKTLAHYGQVSVQDIEKIWHGLKPPYEALFAWLEKKAALPAVEDELFFHPVMLSHPLNEKDIDQIDWQQFAFERKYDGIRVQAVVSKNGKALFSRTGDNISHSFPDLLTSFKTRVILDGELVIKTEAGIGSFNDLQQRLNRKSLTKKMLAESPAAMILYDILSMDGHDLRACSFIERRQHLEQWYMLHLADNLVLSDLLSLNEDETLHHLKEQVLNEAHPAVEGLMLKHKQSPYLAGRPKGHWYKWKREPLTVDAVLMYAQRGQGKRSSYYSDYTFGLWQDSRLLPVGKAYFGFTDAELLKLDQWVRSHTLQRFGPVREVAKELVLEVAFDAVQRSSRHKSGVAMRFPRINRIRWDKPAAEADALATLLQWVH